MKERTSRPAAARGGRKSASRSSGRSAPNSASTIGGIDAGSGDRSRGGRARQATQAAPPAPGSPAAQNIPALSQEAQEQAERDRTGKTRPGYVRRDLPETASFNGVTYQAGAQREVPESFANHLDLLRVSPDASTEVGRETKFGGGKENDQAAQGKQVKANRDGAAKASAKHRETDPSFETIARPKSGSKK